MSTSTSQINNQSTINDGNSQGFPPSWAAYRTDSFGNTMLVGLYLTKSLAADAARVAEANASTNGASHSVS